MKVQRRIYNLRHDVCNELTNLLQVVLRTMTSLLNFERIKKKDCKLDLAAKTFCESSIFYI